MTTQPKLSVVVPVHNERDNVTSLLLEIEAALTFLASMEPAQVVSRLDDLGATPYYQITAAGTLADERD